MTTLRTHRLLWPQSPAGRALVGFWGLLLALAASVSAILLWLGPPPGRAPATRPPALASGRTVPDLRVAPIVQRRSISPPDPALLEPSGPWPADPQSGEAGGASLPAAGMLPRIAADGRTASSVYASPAAAAPAGAIRIAILLDGVGLSTADSLNAIDRLPAAVSLAVSPYASTPEPILQAARRDGHEFLLSLPMEPNRSPLDDEGGMQLSTLSSEDDNARHLAWSLSRIQGYAGITNQSAGLAGERYAESVDFDSLAQGLAGRGLFYIDASPGQSVPSSIAGATADLRIAGATDGPGLERMFLQLEATARSNGQALLVIGPLYPLMIDRLDRWSRSLAEHGLVLVPVSQLVHKPGDTASGTHP